MSFAKYKQSAKGVIYHIYNRGIRKDALFREDADYDYYLDKLQTSRDKNDFSIITFCLMPNHIHLVVKQNTDIPPSKFITSIHTSYSMHFNKKYEMVGHVFEGRYKQKIINDNQYLQVLISYIHRNPLKAGISTKGKYRWSGYNDFLRIKNNNSAVFCDPNLVKQLDLLSVTLAKSHTLSQCFDLDLLGQS